MSNFYTQEQKMEILKLEAAGLSGRKIAQRLGLSKSGVNNYLASTRSDSTIWDQPNIPFVGNTNALENRIIYKHDESTKDNSRVLLISDLHAPYNHVDAIPFLTYLKEKYNPTRVISMGDECDKHSLSFHDSDPNLSSASDELERAKIVIAQLHGLFPEMDILDSNHGSMIFRKAKHHGIPVQYIKSYNEVLGVGNGWRWHFDLTIKLPDDTYCYLHHGKISDVSRLSRMMGMHAAQGHFHESFKIDYWSSPHTLNWGISTGCLIDDKSLAFSYNNVNLKRPIIGTALIIDSQPVLEPMILDKSGRWVGPKIHNKFYG